MNEEQKDDCADFFWNACFKSGRRHELEDEDRFLSKVQTLVNSGLAFSTAKAKAFDFINENT